MEAPEIQTFLNARLSRCLIGTPPYMPGALSPSGSGNTIASACLKDFKQTTTSRPADAYCSGYVGVPNETAAQIIAKVGKACGISQKVLLVMLEKEQSLLTDSWPVTRQYNYALGMNCPDSGPNNSANCDAESAGFSLQLYLGARQLKVYRANPNLFNYKPFQTNTIQWNPNLSCGTSDVYIENWATAALYIYTPYRPNQAALDAGWGTGDGCSSYGNRNFFLFYTTWFGSTQGVSHAHLDLAKGEYNGIRLSGWARKLTDTGTAYVWANVYDTQGNLVTSAAIAANQDLNWFDAQFPGWGASHGFNSVIAVSPGTYVVKVYNSSVNSELFETRTITIPLGQGHVDTVSQAIGGIRLQGWSVDFRQGLAADNIRVVLDGKTLPNSFPANKPTNWIDVLFPGLGNNHAFDFVVPASLGTHSVCVFGAVGQLNPCATITISRVEHGNLDSVSGVEGGARLKGWAVDLTTADPITLSVTAAGTTTDVVADKTVSWFDAVYPGAGTDHGFETIVPLTKSGTYEFCIAGKASGKKLHCKTASVLIGEGISFDSVTGLPGQIQVTGWATTFGKTDPSYIWVNVDGVGGAYLANQPLSWFEDYSPGSGNNHGFDVKIPASAGTHQVCVYAASSGTLAGCKSVVVPVPREQGYLDGVEGGSGSIRAFGWSHIVGQPAPSYVWVDVDGKGAPYRANTPLNWFDSFAPGQGTEHGFDVTIPAAPGTHRVCVSGSNGPTPYGCKTVSVQ